MVQIAYILLCHKDPEGIIAQAERLTAAGDCLAIHFDGRASSADYEKIRSALAGNKSVVFAQKRIRCGWGEWSLVAATLEALRAAESSFARATHFFMLSGDCMPIKSAAAARAYLERKDVDYIESFDFYRSNWIKTGIREERLIYRHFFNERSQKTWFYRTLAWQKKLGLKRKPPADLELQIGSQWWCLRRPTVEAVLDFIRRRPDVTRFFRRCWIPDEIFFQTIVRHLVPEKEISSRPLTFLMFTDYGMPVTFYNDHYDLLLGQDYLFARKISPEAQELRARLGTLYTAEDQEFRISDEGRNLYRFVSARGRVGVRFARRFWARGTSLGRDRVLLMVTCKKWHVAKRFVARAQQVSGGAALDYLFDEAHTAMPDLGGIQSTLDKRIRHRRLLVRMLYDFWQTDRLMFCIDPAALDLIRDFYDDTAQVRLLEIQCDFSEDYLIGHARRIGLAGEHAAPEAIARLLPTLRYDVTHESERLYEAGLPGYYHIREGGNLAENSAQLAGFLAISPEEAREILTSPDLFPS